MLKIVENKISQYKYLYDYFSNGFVFKYCDINNMERYLYNLK